MNVRPAPDRDGVVVVNVNEPVTFSWIVEHTDRCRIGLAEWSDAAGASDGQWYEADATQTITHDKTGVYRYQLTCDPGFAIDEEPEVVTVRVVAGSGLPGGGGGSTTPPPTGGAGEKPRGGGGSLGLDLLLPMLLLTRYARPRRRLPLPH